MPTESRSFRRIVNVDGDVAAARIVMAADNEFTLWVNGNRTGTGNNFKLAPAFEIADKLKPGPNTIAVVVENGADEPNPAGLIGALKIRYRDGRIAEVFTDGSWEAAKSAPEGWQRGGIGSWTPARELGPLGVPPWGDVSEAPAKGRRPADPTLDLGIAARALEKLAVPPDFEPASKLGFIHKKIDGEDVYFVANPETQEVEAVCAFRTTGRQPELWLPDSGKIVPVTDYEEKDGLTRIPLRFDPSGSLFVVFRDRKQAALPASGKNWTEYRTVQEITGPWKVSFDPKWGGPEQAVEFASLKDWSKRPEDGIRFYSGTAVYRKTIHIPSDLAGKPLFLDLGKVAVIAEVSLNGKDLGTLWKPPFRVDISGAAKAGDNSLEIKVVNLWANRLIGDENLPEDSQRKANGNLDG